MDRAVVERCERNPFVLDVYRDRSGTVGAYLLVEGEGHLVLGSAAADLIDEISHFRSPLVCFDSRRLLADFPRLSESRIHDVRLLYGGESNLARLAKNVIGPDGAAELRPLNQRLAAHLRACRTAQVDMDSHPITALIPSRVVQDLFSARAQVTIALWKMKAQDELQEFETEVWPLTKELYDTESVGIRVDVDYVKEQLKTSQSPAAEKVFRSIDGLQRDGYVYTRFSPVGGKTGRIRTEGGFAAMTIPHGPARNALVSRFEGGKIYAFDFNAIDYRCIVASVEDPGFREKYGSCEDFHSRTASFLFGKNVTSLRRDVIKQITYVFMYGGSDKTLSEKTGLSPEVLQEVLRRLHHEMGPIGDFRDSLVERAKVDGFVTLPNGRKVVISLDDHPGKILGLYAQSYSSIVFRDAFLAAKRRTRDWKSKVIFTVHDELAVDMHPDEFCRDVELKDVMERASGAHDFKVKFKSGRTYGIATD